MPETAIKYFIGQRVIVNDEICTVVKPEKGKREESGYIWVFVPSRKYASNYAEHNVKPLPNGEL